MFFVAGTALADVLYGKANPSGRMSETVFTSLDQLPADYLSLTMSDAPGRTHRRAFSSLFLWIEWTPPYSLR